MQQTITRGLLSFHYLLLRPLKIPLALPDQGNWQRRPVVHRYLKGLLAAFPSVFNIWPNLRISNWTLKKTQVSSLCVLSDETGAIRVWQPAVGFH